MNGFDAMVKMSQGHKVKRNVWSNEEYVYLVGHRVHLSRALCWVYFHQYRQPGQMVDVFQDLLTQMFFNMDWMVIPTDESTGDK